MLRSLDIADMLIIDKLDLAFQPGLNVLTGETGAGKSILLDSLGFVLGWRGRAELVRKGADHGEVVATFHLTADHPAQAVLADAGITVEDGELILRRINMPDGRKTAWINGTRAAGDLLRRVSETLVELHGQHDDRGLLNPRGHRALLDEFGGLQPKLRATQTAWADWRRARQSLDAAEQALADLRAEEDFLRHAVAEFEELDPQPGEDAELDAARRLMQNAERVQDDIAKAYAVLSGDGAEAQVATAIRWLEPAAEAAAGQLEAPLDALARALDALGEADQGIVACLEALRFDAGTLETTEERLFAIRALARKHDVQPEGLVDLRTELATRLARLDASTSDLATLYAAVTTAHDAYTTAACALTKARQKAATKLAKEVTAELAPLKMERAVFGVSLVETEPGPDGQDEVTFTVATNPGAPAGPLGKIASGGELSRFLLALKVCLTRDSDGLTMIFDEIDRGVGGATANAVGRRLADLAAAGQVLVVTHSPQVAALGAHHWRVEKSVVSDVTTSRVVPLDAAQRVDEIARMLSGDTITDAARGAARELLSDPVAG